MTEKGKLTETLKDKVPFCFILFGDHPGRAELLNEALLGIVDTLQLAKPLIKENMDVYELAREIYNLTVQALSVVNINNTQKILEITEKIEANIFFEKFLNSTTDSGSQVNLS